MKPGAPRKPRRGFSDRVPVSARRSFRGHLFGLSGDRGPVAGSVPLVCVVINVLCCPGTGVSGFSFFEEGISV